MSNGRTVVRGAALATLLWGLAAATGARAQVLEGIHACDIAATAVAFGTVTGVDTTTGTITLACQGAGSNNPYTVTLSTGLGSYSQRQMRRGQSRLSYNLYTDPSHTLIWGDGSGGSHVVSGTIAFRTSGTVVVPLTVYGLVPNQPFPVSGPYRDTIVATVSF
jgi:spore coat protein U-like protein